ncbi:MAG: SDR family NAD(P)-dependent oxidoreductase [Gemmatimonadota bacterium]
MKTILITGATDGIGLETARRLASSGCHLLMHGRNETKLERVAAEVAALPGAGPVDRLIADLSVLPQVEDLARAVSERVDQLDVLINNAGVFNSAHPKTESGVDVRFVVNTFAPALLTTRLLPLLGPGARVINLSSAAQSPVDLRALAGARELVDGVAYAQSKLALTMWSQSLARSLGPDGPTVLAVNPGSLLATKMVHDAFGVAGADVGIGADVLCRAALDADFDRTGEYYDNDARRFAAPHPDALDPRTVEEVVGAIERVVGTLPTSPDD